MSVRNRAGVRVLLVVAGVLAGSTTCSGSDAADAGDGLAEDGGDDVPCTVTPVCTCTPSRFTVEKPGSV